ncbi:MFS transporter [Nocardia sp. NPDC003482]
MASTTTPPSPGKRHLAVLALGSVILSVDGYDLFTVGTIGPSLLHDRSWGATPSTLGTLGSVTALGMPFGSILAGWAADRWGRRLPLTIVMVWISAAMLAAALAPDLTALGLARFCTGIGIGALAPLVGAAVSDGAPPRRRTLHLAIAMGSIGIGGTVSALLGRILLSHVHFQTLFLIGALAVVLAPVIWWVFPAGLPHRDDEPRRVPARELFTADRRGPTLLFWVATFASMALVYSTTAWLPTVLVRNGYSLNSSLEFTIVFTIGASAGGLLMAVPSDRGHLKGATVFTFGLAAAALLALSSKQPHAVLLVVSAMAGLGSLGCQNMIISYMARYYPPRLRGTALGLGLGVGRLGSIVGPTYLSIATSLNDSPRAGFVAFVVPALLGVIVVSFLPATRGRPEQSAPPAVAPIAVEPL